MSKYVAPLDSSERVLADGRVIVPGETFELSKDDLKDEHNQRLLDEEQMFEVKAAPKSSEGG